MNQFKEKWLEMIAKSDVPRAFSMIRNADESGTSGTGKVLDGVIFPCGKVAVCWDTANNPDSKVDVNSVSVFDSLQEFQDVHIGQHPTNKTQIIWY